MKAMTLDSMSAFHLHQAFRKHETATSYQQDYADFEDDVHDQVQGTRLIARAGELSELERDGGVVWFGRIICVLDVDTPSGALRLYFEVSSFRFLCVRSYVPGELPEHQEPMISISAS